MSTPEVSDLYFIEPVPAVEIHADGVAVVRVMDDDVHMVLYADHVGLDGGLEHHVVARIIMREARQQAGALVIAQAVDAAMRTRRAGMS